MNQIKERSAAATRQFADAAAQANRLALANVQDVFGLQLATLEKNAAATFAYLGELAEVRDAEGLKAVLPKGVQVARENIERAVSAGQEVVGRSVKAGEDIGQIAQRQFETATAQARAEARKVVRAAKAK